MNALEKTIRILDSILEWVGRVVQWLVVPMTLVLVYEVVTRRIFNSPNIWTITVATQIFSLHFLLYSSKALLKGAHVRVDILYQRLSPRNRAILDLITYPVMLIIPSIILVNEGYKYAAIAWTRKQVTQSLDRIPLYPIKSFIPIAFVLLAMAGVSEFLKKIVQLRKGDAR